MYDEFESHVTILHDPGAAGLRGTIRRVHGLGAARRVEIALAEGGYEHLIEVDTAGSDNRAGTSHRLASGYSRRR
jgi:hypothetical protein